MSNIGGWGRGAWGDGAWGQPVPVVLTGVAATTGLGTPLAGGGSLVGPVGAVGTIGFGDEQVVGTAVVAVTQPIAPGRVRRFELGRSIQKLECCGDDACLCHHFDQKDI